ncbi:MAG: Rieske 2Fe-2S domain-containing protein [Chloroflexi bacterium]|nr:Rieske 2Fe-2S domain-containing protein [Chloroflexota bacterium]
MNAINRRSFLKLVNRLLAATGLAVVVVPVISYFFPAKLEETPSEPVRVCKTDELPTGESKTVPFGRYPALVINTPQGLRAYSAVCTHFACICKWDAAIGQIACPCHEGYFDPLDGHVLAGPPPTPLKQFKVEDRSGEIYVGGEA